MLKKLIFLSLLSIILASCPDGSLEWQKNCYFFQNETVGFAEAEIDCVGKNGHLVSIHDSFTDALLAQEGGTHFPQSTISDFWIGLTLLGSNGSWSWMDNTILDYTYWAPGEPKNVTGNNCAGLSIIDGYWRSDDCFKAKPYICKVDKSFYDPPTTTTIKTTTTPKTTTTSQYPIYANCHFPFTYFQPTHSCYGVANFTGPVDWTHGEQLCMAWGGHLTSIHSKVEMLFLGSYVYTGHNGYWTGAFSNDGGISWQWSDRTPWDFDPFTSGYPNTHQSACGTLWGPSIGDRPCNIPMQIICKKSL